VRASRNPPSVLTILRYAAYLNKVQRLLFDLAFLRAGQIFHSLLETSGFTITVRQVGFFSVLLPIISDYPSPDRTCCMEGGVSSAVAVIVHRLAPDSKYSIYYFRISIEENLNNQCITYVTNLCSCCK
jgi:hypothetical protein